MLLISVGTDSKELGARCPNVWNFAREWNFKPIFTQKWASEDMNWGVQPLNPPRKFQACSSSLIVKLETKSSPSTRNNLGGHCKSWGQGKPLSLRFIRRDVAGKLANCRHSNDARQASNWIRDNGSTLRHINLFYTLNLSVREAVLHPTVLCQWEQ